MNAEGRAGRGGRAEAAVRRALVTQKSLVQEPALTADLVRDLGLTSFDMMELCVRIEEGLGCSVDFGVLVGVRTVDDLVRAVQGSLTRDAG